MNKFQQIIYDIKRKNTIQKCQLYNIIIIRILNILTGILIPPLLLFFFQGIEMFLFLYNVTNSYGL